MINCTPLLYIILFKYYASNKTLMSAAGYYLCICDWIKKMITWQKRKYLEFKIKVKVLFLLQLSMKIGSIALTVYLLFKLCFSKLNFNFVLLYTIVFMNWHETRYIIDWRILPIFYLKSGEAKYDIILNIIPKFLILKFIFSFFPSNDFSVFLWCHHINIPFCIFCHIYTRITSNSTIWKFKYLTQKRDSYTHGMESTWKVCKTYNMKCLSGSPNVGKSTYIVQYKQTWYQAHEHNISNCSWRSGWHIFQYISSSSCVHSSVQWPNTVDIILFTN